MEEFKISDVLEELLIEAVEHRASDIHIEPMEKVLRIRFRIDGELKTFHEKPKTWHAPLLSRLKIVSKLNIAERRKPQDGRMERQWEDRKIDMRISIIATVNGEKAVIRILDPREYDMDMESLGLDGNEIRQIRQLMKKPNGILLVAGPTGCGKSTTLYTMLKELNQDHLNIITLEDPVEYRIDGINQIQIQEQAGLGFDNMLKFLLRADPSIMMVGEIRDEETAKMAIRAAITGHRILSTIHTNDSYGSIERLMDMGIPDYLLRTSMIGVLSQRLLRRLCPYCKEKYKTPESVKALYSNPPEEIYRAKGCEKCQGGYQGRLALMEILELNDEMAMGISNNMDMKKFRELGIKKGIETIFQKALKRVKQGEISIEEAMKLSFIEWEDRDGETEENIEL